MEKTIYQDENGLYFVDYDPKGEPIKVYCDETGSPLGIEENTLEIFQQEDGTYYYVAHNELGEPYKVACDENGNDITIKEDPYVAPVGPATPVQNEQVYNQQVAAGTGFAGAATAASTTYQNVTDVPEKKSSKEFKSLAIALLSGALVMFGGYFAYSQFSGNGSSSSSLFGSPTANMEGYMVDVKFSGKDGEGEAEAKVSAIPNVTVSDSAKQKEIDNLLTNAEISYSKQAGLKNGDQVSISVNVDEADAEKAGVKLEGAFKQSFKVSGLSEAKASSSESKKESSSDSSKKESSNDTAKKESSEEPKKELEYKQVYNTGYKGLLMRTGPSQSYPAITTLFDGTPVQILEYSGSWAKVNYNGTQGWMYTGYLR